MNRKILRLPARLLASLLALLLLSGCGGEAPAETSEAETDATAETTAFSAPAQASGTVFSLPFSFSPDTLNPYTDTGELNAPIYSLLFDGLFAVDKTGAAVPRLAADITVNGLTATVTLRSDAVFHDGTALRPADVVWSLENARDREDSVYRARLANIASVSASGNNTVTISLLQPEGDLAFVLDVPIIRLGTGITTPAVGTGRYRLVDGENSIYLLSNDTWFGLSEGEAFPLRIIRLTDTSEAGSTADGERLVYAMVSGNASLIRLSAFTYTSATLTGNADAYPLETRNFLYIAFNTSYYAPTADRTLRQAVAQALDLQALLAEVLTSVACSDGLYPIQITGADSASAASGNLAAAAVRMRQAGYTRDESGVWTDGTGTALTFTLLCGAGTEKEAAAERIQKTLTDFGIATQVTCTEHMNTALQNGNFDLALCEARLSPDYDFRFLLASDGSANYNQYTVYGLDGLLTEFYAAGHRNAAEIAQSINSLVQEDLMILPLGYRVDTVYVNRSYRLGGIVPHCSDLFCNLTEWVTY